MWAVKFYGRYFSSASTVRSLRRKPKVRKYNLYKETLATHDGKGIAIAYATADSYDLSQIMESFSRLHSTAFIDEHYKEAVHLQLGERSTESVNFNATLGSEAFIFEDGVTVFWNSSGEERGSILSQIKGHERRSYKESLVNEEVESMVVKMNANATTEKQLIRPRIHEDYFVLPSCTNYFDQENIFNRFAMSHALARSTKLAIFESLLHEIVDDLQMATLSLNTGKTNIPKRKVYEILAKLYGLRHELNLSSEIDHIPDIYWERSDLEAVFTRSTKYFNISERCAKLNSQLDNCVEIVDLFRTKIHDGRVFVLELTIVLLIAFEVLLELTRHYMH